VPQVRCLVKVEHCGQHKPEEVTSLIGKTVSTCGAVTSARCASESPCLKVKVGRPFSTPAGRIRTRFLRAVIWGEDRDKFGKPNKPEKDYLNREICAAGTVLQGSTVPQITAREAIEDQTCSTRFRDDHRDWMPR
jgi:hypothetical protein